MKYKVIRDCIIKGQQQKVDSIVDLDKEVADQLLSIGRIQPYDEPQVENRSIGLSMSSEKPKRRGRAKKVDKITAEDPSNG